MRIIFGILVFTLVAFTDPDPRIIITDEGMEGLVINQSTLRDVQKAFPYGQLSKKVHPRSKGIKYIKFSGSKGCVRSTFVEKRKVRYTYITKGEGVTFKFTGKKLDEIVINDGDLYKTEKGIIPGVSTFRELEEAYGPRPWQVHRYGTSKIYGQLVFCAADTLKYDHARTDSSSSAWVIERIIIKPRPVE